MYLNGFYGVSCKFHGCRAIWRKVETNSVTFHNKLWQMYSSSLIRCVFLSFQSIFAFICVVLRWIELKYFVFIQCAIKCQILHNIKSDHKLNSISSSFSAHITANNFDVRTNDKFQWFYICFWIRFSHSSCCVCALLCFCVVLLFFVCVCVCLSWCWLKLCLVKSIRMQ